MNKYTQLLTRIARALEDAGMPYVVIGGQAVLVYGDPRFTKDIDITLGVDIDQLDSVQRICAGLSLVPRPKDVETFVKQTNVYPVKEQGTSIPVDFIFSSSQFERGVMARANKIEIEDTLVRYASVEDVIILKIAAGRPMDVKDARTIINANEKHDREYVLKWLKDLSAIVGRNLEEDYREIERTIALSRKK